MFLLLVPDAQVRATARAAVTGAEFPESKKLGLGLCPSTMTLR
jgi:hypothetical protein